MLTQRLDYETHYALAKSTRILKNPEIEKDFGISICHTDKDPYNIKANRSLGVGRTGTGFSHLIQIYARLTASNDTLTQVTLFTNPRRDLSFLAFVAVVSPISVGTVSHEWISTLVATGCSTGAFFWFRLIYRLQEKAIFESIQKVLRLKERSQH